MVLPLLLLPLALVASSAIMVAPYANEELKKKEIANSIDHLTATEIADRQSTRLNEPHTGTILLPISALHHDCSQYDIVHLISNYIYNDREHYFNHVINSIMAWFIGIIIICLCVVIINPKWI